MLDCGAKCRLLYCFLATIPALVICGPVHAMTFEEAMPGIGVLESSVFSLVFFMAATCLMSIAYANTMQFNRSLVSLLAASLSLLIYSALSTSAELILDQYYLKFFMMAAFGATALNLIILKHKT